jgi:hypothetical protein
MGLYNMIMGHNPFLGYLMALIGVHRENFKQFGRLRDAWITADAKTIGVLHRNYGDDGEAANKAAEGLPAFRQHQCTDDETYQTWLFDVPEDYADIAEDIAGASDNESCWERYKDAIRDYTEGVDTPQSRHIHEVGKTVIGTLTETLKDGKTREAATEDGSVVIGPVEDVLGGKDGTDDGS